MALGSDVERLRRYWDRSSRGYDKQMSFFDRKLFGDTREWVCAQASGEVLEVAIGTGLNLPFYPEGVRLTGIDFSPGMLEYARDRAKRLGREVEFRVADAQRLEFADASFDTVVSTFALCGIPDERVAVSEMLRVLRPGGLLVLADHVASTSRLARVAQFLLDAVAIPVGGEHFRRRPIEHVRTHDVTVERHDRFKLGIVERLAARKAKS